MRCWYGGGCGGRGEIKTQEFCFLSKTVLLVFINSFSMMFSYFSLAPDDNGEDERGGGGGEAPNTRPRVDGAPPHHQFSGGKDGSHPPELRGRGIPPTEGKDLVHELI